MQKLEGMLLYVQLQKPVTCYDPAKGQEYKVSILVDEDTADAFAEIYPKQAARKVKSAEFEKIYKVAPPEGSGKNLYVITLKKNTMLSNGEPVPLKYVPRVLQRKGKTLVDITATILPANGSYGVVSIDHYEGKMGNIARLKNVLVTELIEYEGTPAVEYEAGSEFDTADDGEGNNVKVPASAKQAAPAAKTKAKATVEAGTDDDDPF